METDTQPEPQEHSSRWEWFRKKAQTKHAEYWLGLYSFFETVILPFPTDPFLALMVLANRTRVVWLTFWTTITSLAGSVFLYGVTVFFFSTLVEPLVAVFGMEGLVEAAADQVNTYTFIAVLAGAFSPFPYTPVVIAAGLFQVNFITLALGAFLGRLARYTLVSAVTLFLGITFLKRAGRIATILTALAIVFGALYFFVQ